MALPPNYKHIIIGAGSLGGPSTNHRSRAQGSGNSTADRNRETVPIFLHRNHGNHAFTPQKVGKSSSSRSQFNDSRGPKAPKPPEKPVLPYMRYSKRVWETVKSQYPDLKMWELGKKIGALWKQLDDVDKQVYIDEYEIEKVQYERAVRAFNASIPLQQFVAARNKLRTDEIHSSGPRQERRVDIQPAEDEDDDDDGNNEQQIPFKRFSRNHQLIHEIFSDVVVPDVRSVVTTQRMQVLKRQVSSLTMHQTKLEAELQQMEEKFEAKKQRMIESSAAFQEELKRHCRPAVDEETIQKMAQRMYEEMKRDRQRLEGPHPATLTTMPMTIATCSNNPSATTETVVSNVTNAVKLIESNKKQSDALLNTESNPVPDLSTDSKTDPEPMDIEPPIQTSEPKILEKTPSEVVGAEEEPKDAADDVEKMEKIDEAAEDTGIHETVPISTPISSQDIEKAAAQPDIVDTTNLSLNSLSPQNRMEEPQEPLNSAPETTSEPNTPQPTTPQLTTPQLTTPQLTTPQITTPQPTAPQVNTPKPKSPQPNTPQTNIPHSLTAPPTTQPNTLPSTISQQTTPEPTAPQPTAPQATTPQATTPQSTTLQPSTPQTTIPQTTTPQQTPPQQTTPQPTTSQPTTSQPTTSQSTTPQPTAPQQTAPQPTATQSAAPQSNQPSLGQEPTQQHITPALNATMQTHLGPPSAVSHHMPTNMPPHGAYGSYVPSPTRSPYYQPQYGPNPPPSSYGQFAPYSQYQQSPFGTPPQSVGSQYFNASRQHPHNGSYSDPMNNHPPSLGHIAPHDIHNQQPSPSIQSQPLPPTTLAQNIPLTSVTSSNTVQPNTETIGTNLETEKKEES